MAHSEEFDYDFDYDYDYKNEGKPKTTEDDENTLVVRDSSGNILQEGDSVTLVKDLKVRGSSIVIKRGTKVKNIRLTDTPAEIEGKVDGSVMVLKTEFLKKA
jgi:protein PhnA